ncbi:3-ketoacyl-CoA thiolase A, peroxisomal-like [Liolophura sinensis]|uniref:3-ketoacyl-CoA thiolase A, peroxisomal-like n=1 Tax=Liolophura sinensis TaxID=3198878 RepID=UPI0031597446
MERLQTLLGHLSTSSGQGEVRCCETAASEREDDVVIVAALRTPICKAKRGNLRETYEDDLLATVFTGVLNQTKIDPVLLGDICVGSVLQEGAGADTARMAQFYSGIPETTPLSAVNRQCSSGLQAVMNLAGSIRNGVCDIGLAAGVESMSRRSMNRGKVDINPKVFENEKASQCLIPMGITSENVATRFGVSRKNQDLFAYQSHMRAAKARQTGLFREEIVPVRTKITDKDGEAKEIMVYEDDGIRPTTTLEGLSKLKPAFQEGGSTTAGNSSQLSDGAAAVLLAKRSAALRHGLPILGVILSYAVVGVPPDVMGIGPAVAIPEALRKAGLKKEDIEIFEINEAFASQCLYCVEKLGLPQDKVNPNGGAIALGHPLGCTGARQIATLLHELKRRGKRAYGVVSMCIGTGMGAAAVLEYPG